jgi:hypothetical protein
MPVLKLHAVVIDMPFFSVGGPNPALAWLSRKFPAVLQHGTESWTQRQNAARCFSLAFRNQEHSIPAAFPSGEKIGPKSISHNGIP